MYKSSSMTFAVKYFFSVFMTLIGLFGILVLYLSDDISVRYFRYAFTAAYGWILIFLVQMPFKLKNITANEEDIVVKDFNGEEIIKYEDIYWLAKLDMAGPWFITIKYRDNLRDRDKKICYIPNQKNQTSFSKDRMTQFIQEKIENLSSRYSKEEAPTTISNLFKSIVIGSPFTFTMLYFGAKSLGLL